jgi:hypothetical protein
VRLPPPPHPQYQRRRIGSAASQTCPLPRISTPSISSTNAATRSAPPHPPHPHRRRRKRTVVVVTAAAEKHRRVVATAGAVACASVRRARSAGRVSSTGRRRSCGAAVRVRSGLQRLPTAAAVCPARRRYMSPAGASWTGSGNLNVFAAVIRVGETWDENTFLTFRENEIFYERCNSYRELSRIFRQSFRENLNQTKRCIKCIFLGWGGGWGTVPN